MVDRIFRFEFLIAPFIGTDMAIAKYDDTRYIIISIIVLLLCKSQPPVDTGNFSLHRITRVNNTSRGIVISNGIYRNV